MIGEALTGLEPFTSVKTACALPGKPRATLYRQRNPRQAREMPPGPRMAHPAALSPGEQEQLLAVLNAERFADKSPAQAWAVLLDEGTYLASVSTMYRVLRAADQVRERRAQAAHPARVRPELTADGPSQVWSWDITKLKGPARGVWFDLFVMLDIFSRKAIHWEVHATENADLARAFIDAAVISNGGIAPDAIHADRGTSMTSKPVAVLLSDLHISQSHSRPHVSNDNPSARRSSRRSSTARPFRASSDPCPAPAPSARCSLPTTTTSTAIQASACTLPHPSTTAPPPRSRPAAPWSSSRPTLPIPAGSAGHPRRRPCPPRSGSTSPPQPSRRR